jgi:hypothetical protein
MAYSWRRRQLLGLNDGLKSARMEIIRAARDNRDAAAMVKAQVLDATTLQVDGLPNGLRDAQVQALRTFAEETRAATTRTILRMAIAAGTALLFSAFLSYDLAQRDVCRMLARRSAIRSPEGMAARFESFQDQVQEISRIGSEIGEISDRTNRLAPSAAARDGEQARGLAVVANAVRKPAERSQSSTTEQRPPP